MIRSVSVTADEDALYNVFHDVYPGGETPSERQIRNALNHDTVYTATLDRRSIELRNGDFEFEPERIRADVSNDLNNLWRNF